MMSWRSKNDLRCAVAGHASSFTKVVQVGDLLACLEGISVYPDFHVSKRKTGTWPQETTLKDLCSCVSEIQGRRRQTTNHESGWR